jgi:mono/diheme cytochrome c family protein
VSPSRADVHEAGRPENGVGSQLGQRVAVAQPAVPTVAPAIGLAIGIDAAAVLCAGCHGDKLERIGVPRFDAAVAVATNQQSGHEREGEDRCQSFHSIVQYRGMPDFRVG